MTTRQHECAKSGCQYTLQIGFKPRFARGGNERNFAFDPQPSISLRVPRAVGVEPRDCSDGSRQRNKSDFPLLAALPKSVERSAHIHST